MTADSSPAGRLDRALASLRGVSVGDALGSQFFVPVNYPLLKRRELPPAPWQWTDDTEMACSVVSVLATHHRIDQDALARSFATHHDFDRRRFIAASHDTARGYASFLGTQLKEPKVVVLVAVRDSQVIGYTYAGVEGHDWMALRGPAGVLYDIVVDPEQRGHGVGRMLLDATIARLRLLGAPQVVLSTAERNERAQRLFARAGFRRTMVEMARELDDGDES